MARIYLPTPLRRLTAGQATVLTDGQTVEEALVDLERRFPGLRDQLRGPTGEVREFINIFVNGAEIRTLQGPATVVRESDEVSIIPAMAGGRPEAGFDLSVQQRPMAMIRPAPVLQVMETEQLLLHEEPDPARVVRIARAIRRDGVLRNPPAAAPSPAGEGQAIVLDGANRVTALRELGAPHIVAQIVNYASSTIALSTWRHYVAEDGKLGLRDLIKGRTDLRSVPVDGAAEAEERLGRREALAAVVDARGATLLAPDADPVREAALLRRFVALYQEAARVYRVEDGALEALSAQYGAGTLIIFPPYGKDDIVHMAARGRRLPAGITRYLITARVLHLNVPVALLQGPEGASSKQRQLDAAVEQRWQTHRVRYYAEPTYLFDE
jgi:L-serine kinase (ATP) / ParB family transcriptional regulator, heme-responsive regulator